MSSRNEVNMKETLGKPGPGAYSPSSRSGSVGGKAGFTMSGRFKKLVVGE